MSASAYHNGISSALPTPAYTLEEVQAAHGGRIIQSIAGRKLSQLHCLNPDHPGDHSSNPGFILLTEDGYPRPYCSSWQCDWRDTDAHIRQTLGKPAYEHPADGKVYGTRSRVMATYYSPDLTQSVDEWRFDWVPGDPACWYTINRGRPQARPCDNADAHKHVWLRPGGVNTTGWSPKVWTPQVVNPSLADWIVVPEGAKAARAIALAGAVAISVAGGYNGFDRFDLSMLAGKQVLIWPDHDVDWQKMGSRIRAQIDQVEPADVRIVEPVGAPGSKDDAADLLPQAVSQHLLDALAGEQHQAYRPQFDNDLRGFMASLAYLGLEVRYNARSGRAQMRGADTPDGSHALVAKHTPKWPGGWTDTGDIPDAAIRLALADQCDCTAVGDQLPKRYRLSVARWTELMLGVCHEASCDPWRDWLDSLLAWDSIDRLGTLLSDAWGVTAHSDEYAAQVGYSLLCAPVARTYDPGCVADLMPLFIGPEGTGKSSGLRTLFPPEWQEFLFTDTLTFAVFKDKRALAEQTAGVVIAELAEMVGLSRAELAVVKAVISSCFLTGVRPAYARVAETRLHRFSFTGTANDDDDGVLPGQGEGRRFVPITIPADCNPEKVRDYISDHRDQLWAQAIAMYRRCPTVHLWPGALKEEHRETADEYRREDAGVGELVSMIDEDPDSFDGLSMAEIYHQLGCWQDKDGNSLPLAQVSQRLTGSRDAQLMGRALKNAKWTQRRASKKSRKRVWYAPKPESTARG